MNNDAFLAYAYGMSDASRNIKKIKKFVWESLRSPKVLSFLKLAGAVVGVVHAIDELSSAPRTPKGQIGFKPLETPKEDADEDSEDDYL